MRPPIPSFILSRRAKIALLVVAALIVLFIFAVIMAIGIGVNVVIAYAARPPFRPMSAEQQNLERYRVVLEPRKRLILGALLVIIAFAAGMAAQGDLSLIH